MRYTHDVIIIGGGSGGLTATAGLAQLGLKTLLVEKERLGGDCLFYGCVPSKTLIQAAKVHHLSGQGTRYGLPALEPQSPKASDVMAHVGDAIDVLIPHDSPERFRGLGAQVEFGSARFVSPHEINLDGTTYSARSIILSTGSEPVVPPIPGLAEADTITNKTVFSLKEFPKRLVTIGGGPIGVELSQSLARFGVDVTILEMAPHVLPKDDADMAAIVTKSLEDDGVKVKTSVRVERVEKKGGVNTVFYGDGEKVDADLILVAAGRKASLEGLDLDKAGIEVDRGYVKTNSHLATTAKNVLAVGDVNGKYMFTHVAGAEGSLAVRKVAFRIPITMDYSAVPWCTYSEPELASIGLNETMAKEQGVRYEIADAPFSANDRAVAEAETVGRSKALLDKKGRLIGMQIVGAHAGELLAPALYAFRNKWKMMDIMAPIFPYPTRMESHKKVAGNYLSPKIFNDRVRGILKAVFRYRG